MKEKIMESRKLGKQFGNFWALKDVDITIETGDIFALVGRNGAGKTTMLKLITGQIPASTGEFSLFGKTDSKEKEKQRRKMGAIIENPGFFSNFTAKENLEYYRIQRGIPDKRVIQKVLKEVSLENTGKRKFKDFSLGMKQRLGLALALMAEPALLVLDEPINGLDPEGIVEIRNLLLRLNQEKNMTIIISSHILSELSNLATKFAFIDKGKIIQMKTAEELGEDARKYLELEVDDVERTVMILEENYRGVSYKVLPDHTVRLFGCLEESDIVNHKLNQEEIHVYSIARRGEDLEQYYLNLIGGIQSA